MPGLVLVVSILLHMNQQRVDWLPDLVGNLPPNSTDIMMPRNVHQDHIPWNFVNWYGNSYHPDERVVL